MKAKLKWAAIEAMPIAESLITALVPACERVCFAGSLRRRRPEVGDIEILYVPKLEMLPDPLDIFGTPVLTNLADGVIARLEANEILARRQNVNGQEMFGEKNKLMLHSVTGIPVDLFSTTLENWWVSLVVRTGSKETNLRLTNAAIERGRSLIAYGAGVRQPDGQITPAHSEREVFELCGVPYLEPQHR